METQMTLDHQLSVRIRYRPFIILFWKIHRSKIIKKADLIGMTLSRWFYKGISRFSSVGRTTDLYPIGTCSNQAIGCCVA